MAGHADGGFHRRGVDGVTMGQASFWLPQDLPLGWRRSSGPGATGAKARATLVVVPNRLTTADALPAKAGRERTWGLMAQLSVRFRL